MAMLERYSDYRPYESQKIVRSGRSIAYQTGKWEENFQKLLKFREDHNHCIVPYFYRTEPSLARWVSRQRKQYCLLIGDKPSDLTRERVKMLDDIGFVWDSCEAEWLEGFQELVKYKETYGNCMVPSNFRSNQKLSSWVKIQRREYKLFQEGNSSKLTEERILMLEKLGFRWRPFILRYITSPKKLANFSDLSQKIRTESGFQKDNKLVKINTLLLDPSEFSIVSDITNDKHLKDPPLDFMCCNLTRLSLANN